jgi:phage replication O-like protein O
MAIHESLLDDVSPSDSAVQRLRKRNRKIKPWESDLVLAPETLPATEVGGATGSEPSTVSVLGAEKVPSNHSKASAGSVVNTADIISDRNPLISKGSGHLDTESVVTTTSVPVTDLLGATGTVLSNGLGLGDKSVVSSSLGTAPNSVSDTKTVLIPTLDLSTDPVLRPQVVPGSNEARVDNTYRETATVLDTESVLSHDAELSPAKSTKNRTSSRAQTYLIQEGEGFTRLPHQITEALQREDFTARQLKILITILRETVGWGREFAVLSANDFKNKTGIAAPHIFVTLRDLEAIGAIIRKLNGKNAKNGYSLNRNFFSKYLPKRERTTKSELNTDLVSSTQIGTTPDTNAVLGGQYRAGTTDSTLNLSDYSRSAALKKDLNINLKNSLSVEPLQMLLDFTETIRPRSKKESERDFLDQLLLEYLPEEIYGSLQHVQKHGVLGSAESCHSPFRYLSTAIEQVLVCVKRQEKNTLAVSEQHYSEEKGRSEEIERLEIATNAFKSTLTPEEQEAYVDGYIRSKSVGGFCLPRGIAIKLAVSEWYAANHGEKCI